jgi:hypothetical protein
MPAMSWRDLEGYGRGDIKTVAADQGFPQWPRIHTPVSAKELELRGDAHRDYGDESDAA